MNRLEELAEYAKDIGVSSRLKPQPGGYDTLFILANEYPSNSPNGTTMWKDVFTIDESEGGWKARFGSTITTRKLTFEETKSVVKKWAANPSNEVGNEYPNT